MTEEKSKEFRKLLYSFWYSYSTEDDNEDFAKVVNWIEAYAQEQVIKALEDSYQYDENGKIIAIKHCPYCGEPKYRKQK